MSILVVLEHSRGKWNPMSLEALAAAKRIGEAAGGLQTSVAVLGSSIDALVSEAARFGVQKVFALDHPLLAQYTADGYTAALEQLIRAQQPKAIVFPHTYQVRDYAPKISTRFDKVFVSDIVDVKNESGQAVYVRQLFQGKLNADVRASGEPQFVSVQAGAFRAVEQGGGQAGIERFAVRLEDTQIRSKPEEPFREAQRSVDLTAADIIVSVGRGIKEKDNLPIVEELATVLGAELAASRPICDNGWLPMERQVGSSGQTVSPKVYFAVGISGAIQHLVGMKGSKIVVAINKDETAPIFETADYGAVGDLFEIVPALVEEIKKTKA
jgi:electron transfer flavoprotein alpha subunit